MRRRTPSAIDPATLAEAEASIRRGSRSFAAAARLFEPAMRADAVLLYAWCRHCDDVIDGQVLGYPGDASAGPPAADRLDRLRAHTRDALAGRPVAPVFGAFGELVRRHAIPERYVNDHLDGFAMDVAGRHYHTVEDTLAYCYAVAGVVGLMMAFVMGVRDEATLQRACDLGLAFQLTNIARDIVEDAINGRVYLPADWLRDAGIPAAGIADPRHRKALAVVGRRVVEAAEPYYRSAAIGVRALPFRAAWAVATALGVYRAIGTEVVRRGPAAWDARVSTSAPAKLVHVSTGAGAAAAARFGLGARSGERYGLWSRPTELA